MGILKRLLGIKEESTPNSVSIAGESLDQERITNMFERQPSFSLVAIPGDVESDIPMFLSDCGYETLSTGKFSGPFAELYAGIEQPCGPENSIVQKAWFMVDGHTILLDPEMVLVTKTANLADLAAKVADTVKVAIWERVSESVALIEIGAQGILRQTWYCQGEKSDEAINGYSEIANQPNSEGLKLALEKYGLSDDLFSNVDSNVIELR